MAMKDEIVRLEIEIEKLELEIAHQRETIREQEEELRHYRTAVAAVKWLWDQAQKQHTFRM